MYYNMRIKSIKRTFSNLIQTLEKGFLVKWNSLEDVISLFEKTIALIHAKHDDDNTDDENAN